MPKSSSRSVPSAAPPRPEISFIDIVRTVARGKSLSRPLDEAEAEAAMAMILGGAVAPVQLGAFMAILRYRRETAGELVGFVRAARASFAAPAAGLADLDWPSYADQHRQLPYFLLAALVLADAGVRVVMHGIEGAGPATTRAALAALGIDPASSFDDAARALGATGFSYVPTETFCPALGDLFGLKRILGLRSPANSFSRQLNPFAAPYQLQGVFHPTYLPLHSDAARLLGQPHCAIFKGGGGEVQRNPEKPCRVALVDGEAAVIEEWPALTTDSRHGWRSEPLDPAVLGALWRGEVDAPGPHAAVTGTLAIALKLLGRAASVAEADAAARDMWAGRVKSRFS